MFIFHFHFQLADLCSTWRHINSPQGSSLTWATCHFFQVSTLSDEKRSDYSDSESPPFIIIFGDWKSTPQNAKNYDLSLGKWFPRYLEATWLFQLSPPHVANYHICSWNRRWIISGGMTSIRKLVSLSRSGVVAPEVWTLISRFLWHNLDKELSWGHLKNVFRFSLFLKGKLLGVNIDLICNNKEITLRHLSSVHSNTWLFSGIVRCMTIIGGRQIIK